MQKILINVILIMLIFVNIGSSNTINLTEKEKEYLKNNPIIKVHNETNWPPYNYNKNNKPYGYSIEYMKLLASKVNMNIEFVSGYTWDQFIQMIKENKIDVMLNIAKTKDREKFLSYTSTYHTGVDVIFTKANNTPYNSLDDFKGKTISVVKGFYEEELLRRYYPDIKIITVNSSFETLKLVAFGKADGAVDNLATGNYIISKYQLSNIEPNFEIPDQRFNLDLHLATNKNNTVLRDILEKAKSQITEEELHNLKRIWIFNNKKYENHNSKKLNLSKDEKDYLKSKKIINMCIDPNWMPFEKFDKNGNHIGMTADYFKIFQKDIGIKINVIKTKTWNESLQFAKKRKCDILSLAMQTKKRKEYLNFTTPYLKIPLVLATRTNVPFINDITSVIDKKIGIPKGYAFIELLKDKYKNINIIEVENIQDGLEKVNNGELFGYIGTLASVGHQFQTGYTGELKITGKLDETWELGIAVRNDDLKLLSIFQKVIDNLDVKQQQKILNNWISIKYEKGIDYTLVWKIVVLFLVILLIVLAFLYNQNRLKNSIKNEKEKFEAIYQGSKDSIAILDMKSNFLEVNNSYCEMTGFTEDELLAKSCLELTMKEDIPRTQEAMKELQRVGFIRNFEKECITKNKNILINMSMSLLSNPLRILISVRDVTERKRQEKVFQEQAKLASMGEMIGNIAHQWRQPLSIISTSATGLQMDQEFGLLNEEKVIKACESINDNAQYLSKTIDDFTNFIKGDRQMNIFNLSDSIKSFLTLVDGIIKKENINIVLKLENNIDINGYKDELVQCFINIFNNAKDILVEKEVKNKIIFINTFLENNKVIIEIIDNAGGIPLDVIDKIFEPYFTTKHQSQGIGLGLHMTYSLIVDGMDGQIEASNIEYKHDGIKYEGAKFKMIIPI